MATVSISVSSRRRVTEWRECPKCHQQFLQQYRTQRFCSRICYGRSGTVHEERPCLICTASFHPKHATTVCCSPKCQQRWMRSGPIRELTCKQCSVTFRATRRKVMFCSDTCRSTHKNAWTPERKAYSQSMQARRNEQQRQRLAKMTRAQRILPGFNSRYKARITLQDIEAMLERQQDKCALCNESVDKWEIDHIVPLANGGISIPGNLQVLCRPCNVGKWTMSVDDYIAHCMRVSAFAGKARDKGAKVPSKSSKASY